MNDYGKGLEFFLDSLIRECQPAKAKSPALFKTLEKRLDGYKTARLLENNNILFLAQLLKTVLSKRDDLKTTFALYLHKSEILLRVFDTISSLTRHSKHIQHLSEKVVPTKETHVASKTYWNKGTGFGTGATNLADLWHAQNNLIQEQEREHFMTCLFDFLASYIECCDKTLLLCLLDGMKSYNLVKLVDNLLSNDSVFDISMHISLYLSVLVLCRSLASNSTLKSLLLNGKTLEFIKSMQIHIESYEKYAKLPKDDEVLGLSPLLNIIINELKVSTVILNDSVKSTPVVDYCELMRGLQFDAYPIVSKSSDGHFKVMFGLESLTKERVDSSQK